MRTVFVCLILLSLTLLANFYGDYRGDLYVTDQVEMMQGDIGAFQATINYELSKVDRILMVQTYAERLLCVTETQADENARMRETIIKAQKIVTDLIAERDALTVALEQSAKSLDQQIETNGKLVEELERWDRLNKLIPDFLKPILLGK